MLYGKITCAVMLNKNHTRTSNLIIKCTYYKNFEKILKIEGKCIRILEKFLRKILKNLMKILKTFRENLEKLKKNFSQRFLKKF